VECERRRFGVDAGDDVNLMALSFTLAGIVFATISLAAVAAVPPILEAVFAGAFAQALARTARWQMMIALFMAACAMIYRFAPSQTHARWR
jgi:membrane protein